MINFGTTGIVLPNRQIPISKNLQLDLVVVFVKEVDVDVEGIPH
jgi:hypothetical protein